MTDRQRNPLAGDPRGERIIGLDVARALAIAMVLVSHCSDMFALWFGAASPAPLARAGFLGVELFFVLSGVLIGRLLLDIVAASPSPRAWLVFMVRRWMRTLPMYFVWLAVLALFWPPRFWEPGHAALWRMLPWFSTLTQNFAWPMVGHGWFGVSWSLAIEEWFYLLFSAALIGGAMLAGPRRAIAVCLSVFLIAPLALRWWTPESADWDQSVRHVVIDRLDAIAYGVAAAWIVHRRPLPPWVARATLLAGTVLIGLIWSGWLDIIAPMGPRPRQTLLVVLVLAGWALMVPGAVRLRRLPVWLALLVSALSRPSYSLYLVHLSVLEWVGYYGTRWDVAPGWRVTASMPVIYGLALAGYWLIERPILSCRPAQPAGLGRGDGCQNVGRALPAARIVSPPRRLAKA